MDDEVSLTTNSVTCNCSSSELVILGLLRTANSGNYSLRDQIIEKVEVLTLKKV